MKTKILYSGILSVLLMTCFYGEARNARAGSTSGGGGAKRGGVDTKINPSRVTPGRAQQNRDVINAQAEARDAVRSTQTGTTGRMAPFVLINLNKAVDLSEAAKSATATSLSKVTSLSKEQVLDILSSRNTEINNQLRLIGIQVRESPESVRPEMIDSLTKLAYILRGKGMELFNQDNPPVVNILRDIANNMSDIPTWNTAPRTNVLKLVEAFNNRFTENENKEINERISISQIFNLALKDAENIRGHDLVKARKREIREFCRI